MAYFGYITTLKNVRAHPNADRMKLAECFGNTVCVSLDAADGDVVIYFPTDGQLSVEYCEYNNLVRKKDENGNNIGGYLDPDKRNIRAIKLRGEKSDGLVMPLESLAFCFESNNPDVGVMNLSIGDRIDVVNGHEICKKYIPRSNPRRGSVSEGNKTRKKKVAVAPLFVEHADTEQLAYNLGAFKPGDEIEITLKMHGTSQRTAYLPVIQPNRFHLEDSELKSILLKFMPVSKWRNKLIDKWCTPIYDWGYVSGTRRTVLENYDGGYYGSNEFREQHSKFFEGKLWKGEEVYYEVVGFTHTGAPIMASCDNKKLNDKDFIKQYGDTTTFSYGCLPFGFEVKEYEEPWVMPTMEFKPKSDIYVYRMTMTNEDGDVVEYTPDFMRYRCEQMGVKTVPVLWNGIIPYTVDDLNSSTPGARTILKNGENAGELIKEVAEIYYDGPDPVGKTHVREGVVVRIINRPKFAAYKHKNFEFKCLEGIIKANADAPDIEEAQDIENNEE